MTEESEAVLGFVSDPKRESLVDDLGRLIDGVGTQAGEVAEHLKKRRICPRLL